MTRPSSDTILARITEQALLESGKRPKTRAVLNQSVADLSKAVAMIHQIHWYMRGPGFLSLHSKMDELMDDLNAHLDELSERLITLGGAPYSTLREFDEASLLVDSKGDYSLSVQAHLEGLVEIYAYLVDLFQVGLELTDEEGDNPSNGLFADAQGACEKTIWMLRAQLGQPAGLYD